MSLVRYVECGKVEVDEMIKHISLINIGPGGSHPIAPAGPGGSHPVALAGPGAGDIVPQPLAPKVASWPWAPKVASGPWAP